MNTDSKGLKSKSLMDLRAYLWGALDSNVAPRLDFQDLYRAIDEGELFFLLSGLLGGKVERVWLQFGSFEEIEFYASLRALRFHHEGREDRLVGKGGDGLSLLSSFVGTTIALIDLGKLDAMIATTAAAIEAGPSMLFVADRWFLSNLYIPFPERF